MLLLIINQIFDKRVILDTKWISHFFVKRKECMVNGTVQLVVSLKQEALLKENVTSNPILDSKL